MKYFATSSLNIDNILSTESISPFSFYAERTFGYHSFDGINEIPINDAILLFSEIPSFSIDDPDRENHPMIVQINDEEQLKAAEEIGEFAGCKVFAYANTIHLSPLNCQLLFFSAKAKIIALQNCYDSLMNKLVDYYQFNTISEPLNHNLKSIVNNIDLLSIKLRKGSTYENAHNKVKGFVYGYCLGAIKDLTPSTAKILSLQKRIYDIVSSISNNNGESNLRFDEELKHLDKAIHGIDKSAERATRLWNDEAKRFQLPVEGLNAFLKEYGHESVLKQLFCRKKGIVFPPKMSDYNSFQLENYSQKMLSYVKSIQSNEEIKNKGELRIKTVLDIDPNYATAMLSGEDDESMLFNRILNRIVWGNMIGSLDNLRINRGDVALNVTVIVKSIIEESGGIWNGSKEQLYFHHLRENIQNFTSFDVCDIDNIVLQSLAAFILKGEDFDALVNYLETAAIPVYKYALALWGATLGYVRMPKTIIPKQFDKTWFETTLYKDLYISLYPTSRTLCDGVLNCAENNYPINPKPRDIEDWKDDVLSAFNQLNIKRKRKEFLESLNNALENFGENKDYALFFVSLKEYPYWKTKNGYSTYWNQLKDIFCKGNDVEERDRQQQRKGQKKQKEQSNPGLFDDEKDSLISKTIRTIKTSLGLEKNGKGDNASDDNNVKSSVYFYNDVNAWNIIAYLIPNNAAEELRKDLVWFQSEIRKPKSERYKYYQSIDETNNEMVIERFCHLKEKDKNGKPQAPYFTLELRQKVKEILKKYYANR